MFTVYIPLLQHTAIRIGFELPGYTYTEPSFDEFIDQSFMSPTGRPENGPVFLAKENNTISEQIFQVSFQVTDSTPTNIQSATIHRDYYFGSQLVKQVKLSHFYPLNRGFLFYFSYWQTLSLKEMKHFRLEYLLQTL